MIALKTSTVPVATTYPGSANSAAVTTPTPSPADRLVKTMEQLMVVLSNTGSTPAAASTTTARRQGTNAATTPRTTNPAGGRTPTPEEASTMSYCWSHGFCKRQEGKPEHTGASCSRPRVGHQADATTANKMGGETRICNSWRQQRK